MRTVHVAANESGAITQPYGVGKIDLHPPRDGLWMQQRSWWCPICGGHFKGRSKKLYYFYESDFVFHKIDDSDPVRGMYHRVFEMSDSDHFVAIGYDPDTGRYSCPKLEVDENGSIQSYDFEEG
jgi:hypothetical protein